jgi:transposase InsO family protein
MTVQEKNARRKLSLLQLAVELRNISKACKIMGYSRTHFYEIRRRYEIFGAKGLLDQPPGPKKRHPCRIPEELEERIIETSLENPSYGAPRIAGLLRLQGLLVSSGTVYNLWCRHDMNTRLKRLLLLEKRYDQSLDRLTNHVHADAPGALLNQDTFYFGFIKGVGKIYIQVVIDCYCSFAFAKLYPSKLPETASDLLNSRVLPFYESFHVPVRAILTDNGTEFCGKPYEHPYELFLNIENIQHRRTKVRSPWTNGFVERFNRTLLDEFLRVQGRKRTWITLEDVQRDLDRFLYHYNFQRPHQGYRLNGKTPVEGFMKPTKNLALSPAA